MVLDNLSAHKGPAVHWWLLRHPRFQFHFTPTYASWLNLVERFSGLLTAKALKRGSHTRIPQLRRSSPTSRRTTNAASPARPGSGLNDNLALCPALPCLALDAESNPLE